jgi:hypothetical protein
MASRHHNLSNKNADPARATVACTVTVTFDQYQGAFPKRKFQDWLEALPEDAKIKFTGTRAGKPYFEATWKEARGE